MRATLRLRLSLSFGLWLGLGLGLAHAERIPLTLVQINDVYEISPVQGGTAGGMARLATFVKRLRAENPRTWLVIAGDVISPSALGTAVVDGKPLHGAQMIAALNAAGLDFATLGNHEFDFKREDLEARVAESKAKWFAGNVAGTDGKPFPGVAESVTFLATGAGGGTVRLGLFGVTGGAISGNWVAVKEPLAEAERLARALRPQVDVLVAVTHLSLQQDQQLAATVPGVDLILGGHEHENWLIERGPRFTPIAKADANARTVYVHRLVWDTEARTLSIRSELVRITSALADDPATAKVVAEWTERGFAAFRKEGFAPEEVVTQVKETLDGKESSVRNAATNLTDLVAEALRRECPEAQAALYNAGSVRIDDEIPPGPLTQYDVLRILPFGGKIVQAELSGALLARVLDAGRKNRGLGGFLQTSGIAALPDGRWAVGGAAVDPRSTYRIALGEYLLQGKEVGLEFLKQGDTPGLGPTKTFRDVRFAFIDLLKAAR